MVDTSSAPFPLLLTALSSFSLPMLTLTRCPQLWAQRTAYPADLGRFAYVCFEDRVGELGPWPNWVRRIDICWLLEKITSGEDCMAVDRVQSEPLSGPFPLTGNNTEKFTAFSPWSPLPNALSHWICEAYGSVVRFGGPWNRELLIGYQGMIIP
jgi:hypothetical protein